MIGVSPMVAAPDRPSPVELATPPRRAVRRVLLVDDERDLCDRIGEVLGPHGLELTWRPSGEMALTALDVSGSSAWDVVVADISLRGMSGLELCARVAADFPDLPVVLMSSLGTLEQAVGAVRAGAFDFIRRPFEMNVLALALDRVRHRRPRESSPRPPEAPEDVLEIEGLTGRSPAMRRVRELVDRVAASDAPVLIRGERGTGKERVARALHARGRRSQGPFVAVSCPAIPDARLESELFGHVEGALADLPTAGRGRLLEAGGGTLFLDEITGLPARMQSRLVRALKDRMVRPEGGEQEEPFDARLVVATDRDLETEVERHRFREDLFYRIHVIPIDVPPLRDRGDDILLLAQGFVRRAAGPRRRVDSISAPAAAQLVRYPWPGNVDELESCVSHAVAMARTTEILLDDLPDGVRDHAGPRVTTPEPFTLEAVERRHILRVLAAVHGCRSAAAVVLGLHPSTLYRKLEHYGHIDGDAVPEAPEHARARRAGPA